MASKPTHEKQTSDDGSRSRGELAYDRIESLIAHMALRPGAVLTMQTLQEMTELGRTPVLEATRKLSDDTLLEVRVGRGLRVPPIDLARERRLLPLRREMERFALREAIDNATPLHISQMRRIHDALRELDTSPGREGETTLLQQFNALDWRLDLLILEAAREPFVARTLRPLHTLFRRIGFVYLTHCGHQGDLDINVGLHVDLLEAVMCRDVDTATRRLDDLVGFAESMFQPLETGVDPHWLDVTIPPFNGETYAS